jgi:ABC-type phosphate/phosphonate transport system substrate-binding protein
MRIARTRAACGLLLAGLVLSPAVSEGDELARPEALQIALPRTLFRDIPDSTLKFAGKTYQTLMQQQIGMPGNVIHLPDAMSVAEQLDKGNLHLGVFQGFEFAWARAKYPSLQPLVVAVQHHRPIQACLVVPADSPAKTLADLKGGNLAIPVGTRDHAYLYLGKLHTACKCDQSICKLTKPGNPVDALDDVIDGVLDGALVDGGALESFKTHTPGRAKRLKVIAESEQFPQGVIAYKAGQVDEGTLKKCRDGLLGSEKNPRATVILRMIKLKGFEPPPADYDNQLKQTQEAYPPPAIERATLLRIERSDR